MRHVEQDHRDATGRKATYTQTTYKELVRLVANELGLSATAPESADIKSRSKKRAWGEAGMDPETSGAQRIKGVCVNSLDNIQRINILICIGSANIDQDATPSLPTTQSATTFTPMPSVTAEVTVATVDSFGNISTQGDYANLVGRQSRGDSYYSAPLLQMISSVPYNPYDSDIEWYR